MTKTHYRNKGKTSYPTINQTEKNLTNITTNPETPNRNKGQIIAKQGYMTIIESYIPNHRTMAPVNAVQTSGSHTPKSHPINSLTRNISAFAMSLLLSSSTIQADQTTPTTSQENIEKPEKVVKSPLELYRDKLTTMTMEELKKEEALQEKKFKVMMDNPETPEKQLNEQLDITTYIALQINKTGADILAEKKQSLVKNEARLTKEQAELEELKRLNAYFKRIEAKEKQKQAKK